MNIPDPMVYASLPILGGAAVWIGQQFVQSVISRNRENVKTNTDAAWDPATKVMTVNDYQQISNLLKQELNGRYMFATEARAKFEAVEVKIDHLGSDMKDFISRHLNKSE